MIHANGQRIAKLEERTDIMADDRDVMMRIRAHQQRNEMNEP